MLIVRDLASGPRRFVELQRTLPGISTEQLRSRLNRMVADGLLTRQRYREVPPRVDYELTERARDLLPVVGAVARWGWRWTWGEPRDEETVDIGAVLRTLPGLSLDEDVSGSVCAEVRRGSESRHHLLTFDGGRVEIAERDEAGADVRVTGTHDAWVAALGPAADRSGLDVEGDTRLADVLLDALEPHAARDAAVA